MYQMTPATPLTANEFSSILQEEVIGDTQLVRGVEAGFLAENAQEVLVVAADVAIQNLTGSSNSVGTIIDEGLVFEVLIGATGYGIDGDKLTTEIVTAPVEVASVHQKKLAGNGHVTMEESVAVEFAVVFAPTMENLKGFPKEVPAFPAAPGDLE